jgi:hypothetical protein
MEKIMKLNLLFTLMDLFTVLAYPFLFIYSKYASFQKREAVVRVVVESKAIASITS